jgi:IS605 OrfB family transposase
MIRTSKHNVANITNQGKINYLDLLFVNYKDDLETYINYIIDGILPLKTMMSSSLLPTEKIKHSRYKQLIYKQSSEIIRSQIDKSKKRRFNRYKKVYSYFKNNGRQINFTNKKFSELNLKDILTSKYFTKPNLNNISINLDERFFDIQNGNHFDNFIKITLPFFNEKGTRALQVKIPLKQHKHSLSLSNDNFSLRKNIQIKKIYNSYFVNLIWIKDVKQRTEGSSVGIDLGYNKLITTSNNEIIGTELKEIYNKISNKKQGSKNFKNLLTHRDNLINFYVNQIDISDLKTMIIEDLVNVKHKSELHKKINNKLQRWSYRKTIDKISRTCEVNGIVLVKVSPAYTSQTCSCCGHIDKNSRKLEKYHCVSCGYGIDADINASINILNRGIYSSSNEKKDKKQHFI